MDNKNEGNSVTEKALSPRSGASSLSVQSLDEEQYSARECVEYVISCLKNRDSRGCTIKWLERALAQMTEPDPLCMAQIAEAILVDLVAAKDAVDNWQNNVNVLTKLVLRDEVVATNRDMDAAWARARALLAVHPPPAPQEQSGTDELTALLKEALEADSGQYVLGTDLHDRARAALEKHDG